LAVLDGDPKAIGERARAHALQFSWDQSMQRLFGQVYQKALSQAAMRAGLAEPAAAATFAEAA
jgi:hypothetical protein